MQAPLAVGDPEYRTQLLEIFASLPVPGRRLIGIGSGNGYMEAELAAAGWDVLATDPCASALRHCRNKGLATALLALGEDIDVGGFDVSYSDGVLGHLWRSDDGTTQAWEALARLGSPGSFHVTSNDLAGDDQEAQFTVTGSPQAAFYRPPAGCFTLEAAESGWWTGISALVYTYARRKVEPRRREILVLKSLVNERVEAEDLT